MEIGKNASIYPVGKVQLEKGRSQSKADRNQGHHTQQGMQHKNPIVENVLSFIMLFSKTAPGYISSLRNRQTQSP